WSMRLKYQVHEVSSHCRMGDKLRMPRHAIRYFKFTSRIPQRCNVRRFTNARRRISRRSGRERKYAVRTSEGALHRSYLAVTAPGKRHRAVLHKRTLHTKGNHARVHAE